MSEALAGLFGGLSSGLNAMIALKEAALEREERAKDREAERTARRLAEIAARARLEEAGVRFGERPEENNTVRLPDPNVIKGSGLLTPDIERMQEPSFRSPTSLGGMPGYMPGRVPAAASIGQADPTPGVGMRGPQAPDLMGILREAANRSPGPTAEMAPRYRDLAGGEAYLDTHATERARELTDRETALDALRSAIAEAQGGDVTDLLVRRPDLIDNALYPTPRGPVRGSQEYLDALEAELSVRDRHRPPRRTTPADPHAGTRRNVIRVEKQIADTRSDMARESRMLPKLGPASSAADSAAYVRQLHERLNPLRARSDSLGAVRDSLVGSMFSPVDALRDAVSPSTGSPVPPSSSDPATPQVNRPQLSPDEDRAMKVEFDRAADVYQRALRAPNADPARLQRLYERKVREIAERYGVI